MKPPNVAKTFLVKEAFLMMSLSGSSLPACSPQIKPAPIRISHASMPAVSHLFRSRRIFSARAVTRFSLNSQAGQMAPLGSDQGRPITQPPAPAHTHGVLRLKTFTALSMTRLSEILRVDRKTPYNWVHGRPIDNPNARHLSAVLEVISSTPAVQSASMRRAILAPGKDGISCADLLQEQRYQEAKQRLLEALEHGGRSAIPAPPLAHRSVAELLDNRELDDDEMQPIPPSGRHPRPVRISLTAPGRRA